MYLFWNSIKCRRISCVWVLNISCQNGLPNRIKPDYFLHTFLFDGDNKKNYYTPKNIINNLNYIFNPVNKHQLKNSSASITADDSTDRVALVAWNTAQGEQVLSLLYNFLPYSISDGIDGEIGLVMFNYSLKKKSE